MLYMSDDKYYIICTSLCNKLMFRTYYANNNLEILFNRKELFNILQKFGIMKHMIMSDFTLNDYMAGQNKLEYLWLDNFIILTIENLIQDVSTIINIQEKN